MSMLSSLTSTVPVHNQYFLSLGPRLAIYYVSNEGALEHVSWLRIRLAEASIKIRKKTIHASLPSMVLKGASTSLMCILWAARSAMEVWTN